MGACRKHATFRLHASEWVVHCCEPFGWTYSDLKRQSTLFVYMIDCNIKNVAVIVRNNAMNYVHVDYTVHRWRLEAAYNSSDRQNTPFVTTICDYIYILPLNVITLMRKSIERNLENLLMHLFNKTCTCFVHRIIAQTRTIKPERFMSKLDIRIKKMHLKAIHLIQQPVCGWNNVVLV